MDRLGRRSGGREPFHRNLAVRLAWCGAGAAAGLSVALLLCEWASAPLLLASLGGTAVFLFGLTRAPAVQPRALFGGHLGGALIGIACFQAFGDAIWVYALAMALTLGWMLLARCVHPPAGANPVIMVHAHAGFASLLDPVLLGVVALALVAALWSRLYPGLVRWPLSWSQPSPPHALWGGWDDVDGSPR